MSPEELARWQAFIGAVDAAVAARPDLLSSPIGFVLGALVSAGTSQPESAWVQVAGLADLLAYLVVHVRTGEGDAEAVVAALLPQTA